MHHNQRLKKRPVAIGDDNSGRPVTHREITEVLLQHSLLCGPISAVVNLEMSSTARFFDGNAIYGCPGLGNCRMLNFVSIAFCVIDLISMLIRRNHSITNNFHIKLSRNFVFVSMPTFSTVRISNNYFKHSVLRN